MGQYAGEDDILDYGANLCDFIDEECNKAITDVLVFSCIHFCRAFSGMKQFFDDLPLTSGITELIIGATILLHVL